MESENENALTPSTSNILDSVPEEGRENMKEKKKVCYLQDISSSSSNEDLSMMTCLSGVRVKNVKVEVHAQPPIEIEEKVHNEEDGLLMQPHCPVRSTSAYNMVESLTAPIPDQSRRQSLQEVGLLAGNVCSCGSSSAQEMGATKDKNQSLGVAGDCPPTPILGKKYCKCGKKF